MIIREKGKLVFEGEFANTEDLRREALRFMARRYFPTVFKDLLANLSEVRSDT